MYEDFKALARTRKRAFHLEQRDTYNVAAEDEPLAGGCAVSQTTTAGTGTGWTSCARPRRLASRFSGCGWRASRIRTTSAGA